MSWLLPYLYGTPTVCATDLNTGIKVCVPAGVPVVASPYPTYREPQVFMVERQYQPTYYRSPSPPRGHHVQVVYERRGVPAPGSCAASSRTISPEVLRDVARNGTWYVIGRDELPSGYSSIGIICDACHSKVTSGSFKNKGRVDLCSSCSPKWQ